MNFIQKLFAGQPPAAPAKKRVLPWEPRNMYQVRSDVKMWKQAIDLYQGDKPKSYLLEGLYTDILIDAFLQSQINNRKLQVFSSAFSLKNAAGEVDDDATRILSQHPLYRQLTSYGLDSQYHTGSLVELSFIKDSSGNQLLQAELKPRTNVVHSTGMFYPDWSDDSKGIDYRSLKEYGLWILEYYQPGDLGMLNKAVPHVLFKRFAEACWVELAEIYGIPPRVLKTNTDDHAGMARAQAMMRDQGAAAWAIIGNEEELTFADGVVTKGEVYEYLIRNCTNNLSMLFNGAVLGQDTQHGNRSKEESGQEALWLLVQADMAMLEEQWNAVNLPALVKHGLLPAGLRFEFDQAEDTEQLFRFAIAALPYFNIDAEWFKVKFGLEITGVKANGGDNTPHDGENSPGGTQSGDNAPNSESENAHTPHASLNSAAQPYSFRRRFFL